MSNTRSAVERLHDDYREYLKKGEKEEEIDEYAELYRTGRGSDA